MPEPMKHHRDERVVAGPIPTPLSYAYIAACNQLEIAFPQISGGQEVALPYLLNPGCQEAMPEQNRRLSRAGIALFHPKGTPLRRAVVYNFHPSMYTNGTTNLHGGGMLCTQAGGRRALS